MYSITIKCEIHVTKALSSAKKNITDPQLRLHNERAEILRHEISVGQLRQDVDLALDVLDFIVGLVQLDDFHGARLLGAAIESFGNYSKISFHGWRSVVADQKSPYPFHTSPKLPLPMRSSS